MSEKVKTDWTKGRCVTWMVVCCVLLAISAIAFSASFGGATANEGSLSDETAIPEQSAEAPAKVVIETIEMEFPAVATNEGTETEVDGEDKDTSETANEEPAKPATETSN